ncbi:MAG: hypothetical protein HZC55_04150 [Verrucomicrobia bacterium]|nr:hypothetical protein [Verrucomicrobiota bacterium]
MNPKSLCCALAGMTLASCGLTSCASVSSAPPASRQIYQPRVLRLAAGQPVPTRDGAYAPQTDETWHSPAAFAQLEQENLNLAAALTQERNRK